MTSTENMIPCIGCGGLFPDIDGATHRYMESSPGCWSAYGEILANEFSDFRYGKVHQLTVDAYAVQHPGTPSPQSIRSVAIHLMSLCAVLEKGFELGDIVGVKQRAARYRNKYRWLEPPPDLGELTCAEVSRAADADEHRQHVYAWAQSAWSAWAGHHETIYSWLSETGAA